VIDDVQWAEPTMLDLIEYLADWAVNTPLLIACMARPELLDARPSWGGGKLNATSINLEPLTADETGTLVANLLAIDTIDANVRAHDRARRSAVRGRPRSRTPRGPRGGHRPRGRSGSRTPPSRRPR
jgi:hypothetical protein